MVPIAEHKARLQPDEFKSRQVTESYQLQCSIFPEKEHALSVVYVHNPRDVDMLVWFLNGQKKGYTII